MSDSLRPHKSQHARFPCPSPTPGVYSNSCPLSQWCHPDISSSAVPFSSFPQALPATGSFPMSQLFAWGGQSTGVSASASVPPMNTQDWSPLGWTGWISLQFKGLSRVFSNTTVQKHKFFCAQLSSQSNSKSIQRQEKKLQKRKQKERKKETKNTFSVTLWNPWLTLWNPGTAAYQASLSFTMSQNLLKLLSFELVMPFNHLILCHPLLLLPSIFPNIRVFSNESALRIRWPKYWNFSFISPSNEYSGLISFRIDWFDLFQIQETLKNILQHHNSKASIFWCSAFFMVQLSHPYMAIRTGQTIASII